MTKTEDYEIFDQMIGLINKEIEKEDVRLGNKKKVSKVSKAKAIKS